MVRKSIVFWAVVLLVVSTVYAREVSGLVIDASTRLPIAYANIAIKGHALGTISNSNGKFKLQIPDSYQNEKLVVSFMGYSAFEIKVSEIKTVLNIELTPQAIAIQEITINPDSTIFTFLKKVYKKIPENYPAHPTILTGFIRESVSDSARRFLYIAEAITRNYKTSYENSEIGQVEIIKSRKNISPMLDSVLGFTRYYGGIYAPHYSDIVHERYAFIKPASFSKYDYQYKGQTTLNGSNVYVFDFSEKDSTQKVFESGTFYIDARTLAYVQFEVYKKGLWQNEIGSIYYKHSEKKVFYCLVDDHTWVLKSVSKKSKAMNKSSQTDFYVTTEYVTTEAGIDEALPLKYENQVKPSDVFTSIALNYDSTYWAGYTILENDALATPDTDSINKQNPYAFLSHQYQAPSSVSDKLSKYRHKLNYEIGLYYQQYSFPAHNIALTYNDKTLSTKITPNNFCMGYYFLFGYKITPAFSLNYSVYELVDKNVYGSFSQVGLEYKFCLKRGGRQFFAYPALKYQAGFSGYYIGDLYLEQDTEINGKNFEKGDLKIYGGQKQKSLIASLKLKTSLGPLVSLVMGADYNAISNYDPNILFEEKKGIIRTKTYQPFNSEVSYSEDGISESQPSFVLSNWNFSLGISIDF